MGGGLSFSCVADGGSQNGALGYHDDSFTYSTLSGAPNGGTVVDWFFHPTIVRDGAGEAWTYSPGLPFLAFDHFPHPAPAPIALRPACAALDRGSSSKERWT